MEPFHGLDRYKAFVQIPHQNFFLKRVIEATSTQNTSKDDNFLKLNGSTLAFVNRLKHKLVENSYLFCHLLNVNYFS